MEECTSHELFSVRESSLLLQQAIHSGLVVGVAVNLILPPRCRNYSSV
jgi:hypothetical protein